MADTTELKAIIDEMIADKASEETIDRVVAAWKAKNQPAFQPPPAAGEGVPEKEPTLFPETGFFAPLAIAGNALEKGGRSIGNRAAEAGTITTEDPNKFRGIARGAMAMTGGVASDLWSAGIEAAIKEAQLLVPKSVSGIAGKAITTALPGQSFVDKKIVSPAVEGISKSLDKLSPENKDLILKTGETVINFVPFGAAKFLPKYFKQIAAGITKEELIAQGASEAAIAKASEKVLKEESGLLSKARAGIERESEIAARGPSAAKRIIANIVDLPPEVIEKAASASGNKDLMIAAKIRAGEGPDELARRVQTVMRDLKGEQVAQFSASLNAEMTAKSTAANRSIASAIGKTVSDPMAQGQKIQEAYSGAKSGIGKRFDVSTQTPDWKAVIEISNVGKPLVEKIDGILKTNGYVGNQWTANVGKHTESQFNDIMRFRENAKQANNTGDMIGQLRTLRMEGAARNEAGGLKYDSNMVSQIDRAYRDAIGEQLDIVAPELKDAWLSRNAQYSSGKKALAGVEKRAMQDPTAIIKNIQSLKPTDVLRIQSLAKDDPAFEQLLKELRAGYKDALLQKATVNGEVDFARLAKEWSKPDVGRSVLLGKSEDARLSKALSDYAASLDDIAGQTKLTSDQIKLFEKKNFNALESPNLSARISNIKRDTAGNRETLKQLKALDAILGNNNENSFVKLAKDMYDARSLGMTEKGKLPLVSTSKTGAKAYLPIIALGAAGGGGGLALGGGIGSTSATVALVLAAAYAQSPHAAVAAYKLLNKIERIPAPAFITGLATVANSAESEISGIAGRAKKIGNSGKFDPANPSISGNSGVGILSSMTAPVAGSVGGAAVGSQIGDTPEERKRNAGIGALAGLGLGVGGSAAIMAKMAKGARAGERVAAGGLRSEAGAVGGVTKVAPKGPSYADPIYSNAQRAIEEIDMPKAPASQWLKMLDPSSGRGTKDDEMKWTGLDDYLKGKGEGSVTKAELEEYMARNKVTLEEARKGDDTGDVEAWWTDEGGANEETLFSDLSQQEQRAATERYIEEVGNYQEGAPKFSTYQLPGGTNYREVLVKLPSSQRSATVIDKELDALVESGDIGNDAALHQKYLALMDERSKVKGFKPGNTDFTSSHWPDDPNTVLHYRLNDRVDADGKKTLFVEEVQSDWHQRGRKDGYQGDVRPIADIIKDAKAKGWVVEQAQDGRYFANKPYTYQQTGLGETELEAWEMFREDAHMQGVENYKHAVPAAPFSETWHELAMKRIVREAVDKDYDRVAWTTGAPQAERYDLSKQISEVTYERGALNAYDHQGNGVISKQDVKPEEVEAYIGKEPAKKLLEKEGNRKVISGLDLKVGGEGMDNFYDVGGKSSQNIPKYVNKFAKKFGAKVQETRLAEGKGAVKAEWPIATETAQGKRPVFSIDITPAMRQSVKEQGLPMFMIPAVGAGIAGSAGLISSRNKQKQTTNQ